MTVAPERTSLRSSSDFLIIVDIHIFNKMVLAEEYASNFTSQNDLSISIKDSYKRFIIPCLLGIRKLVEENSKISKEKNYDAKETHDSLIFDIFRKSVQIQELKEKSIDPVLMAELCLIQGVYADVMEEIGHLLYKIK